MLINFVSDIQADIPEMFQNVNPGAKCRKFQLHFISLQAQSAQDCASIYTYNKHNSVQAKIIVHTAIPYHDLLCSFHIIRHPSQQVLLSKNGNPGFSSIRFPFKHILCTSFYTKNQQNSVQAKTKLLSNIHYKSSIMAVAIQAIQGFIFV